MESKIVPKSVCKECFDMETIFVYFVNHKKRRVIEEWEYCRTCYPESSSWYDASCYENGVEEISNEEANRLIEQEGYEKHVP